MSDQENLIDLSNKRVACLLFLNKDGLSVEDITEIFSEYGHVVSVNCAGSKFGFRFVRYRTKEEAIRAITGLKGHKSIRLTPVRGQKQKDHNENNAQDRSKQRYFEKRNGQTERADSTKGSQSSQKSNDNQKESNHPVRNGFGHSNNNPKNTNDEVSRENNQNPVRQSVSSRLNRYYQGCENPGEKREENLGQNIRVATAKLAQLHKLRGVNANTFQPPSDRAINAPAVNNAPITSAIVASPPLTHNSTTEQSVMTDLPPPLIAGVPLGSGPTSSEEERIEVVRASDVVVANIHSNIGYQLMKTCSDWEEVRDDP